MLREALLSIALVTISSFSNGGVVGRKHPPNSQLKTTLSAIIRKNQYKKGTCDLILEDNQICQVKENAYPRILHRTYYHMPWKK
jgi:hypothetical protein